MYVVECPEEEPWGEKKLFEQRIWMLPTSDSSKHVPGRMRTPRPRKSAAQVPAAIRV